MKTNVQHGHRWSTLLFAGVLALSALSLTAQAAVTSSGNSPDPSTIDPTSYVYVGNTAVGSLTIDNGSGLSNLRTYLGYNSGGNGTATVDGLGSTWTVGDYMTVGNNGPGTLNILAGGHLTNGAAGYISVNGTSSGIATVDGANSTWTNNSGLYVGYGATGTLHIANGGHVSNALSAPYSTTNNGHIGYAATGIVTVDGLGSSWSNTGNLYVGEYGTGSLSITNGGLVDVTGGNITFGYGTNSVGTITLDGGTLDMHGNNIGVRWGTGTFNFLDGVLKNVGTFGLALHQQGGRLEAGNSPGIMEIGNYGYTLDDGAVLEVELAGNGGVAGTDFDRYIIYGTATLAGSIDVLSYGGFNPAVGSTFNVLTANTINTTGLDINNGFTYSVISGGNGQILQVTAQATPEPATLSLLSLGIVGLFSRRKRN